MKLINALLAVLMIGMWLGCNKLPEGPIQSEENKPVHLDAEAVVTLKDISEATISKLQGGGANPQTNPILLAEIVDDSHAGHGYNAPFPVSMTFGLVYGFGTFTWGTPMPITADVIVGCNVAFTPGQTGFVDFNASNSPDFADFVSHITNGVDEMFWTFAISLQSNGTLTTPGVGGGGPESGRLAAQPDLYGCTVDFVRLIVNRVSLSVIYYDANTTYNEAEWNVVWQIWGTSPFTIESLIGRVEDLVNAGILNQGQGNALIAKLEAAAQQLDKGNVNTAINQLQAFINQVNALINSGILSPEDGQPLIDTANGIINQLSSNSLNYGKQVVPERSSQSSMVWRQVTANKEQ